MGKRLHVPAAAAAAVVAVLVAAAPATAARRVVAPGESIQAAIDHASPGDRIVVLPGTYAENLLITTDRIRLLGRGARLVPPVSPAPTPCDEEGATSGICVAGQFSLENGEPVPGTPVSRVTVRGLRVAGFPAMGIMVLNGSRVQLVGNRLIGNGEYGLAAFASTRTLVAGNRTRGSGEAGIYIGDSPQANARVVGNVTEDNLFGIFQRNAEHVRMERNDVRRNCVGVLVLADAPGPAGDSEIERNRIRDNSKACAGVPEEGFPPVSGIGVLILGGHDVEVARNAILRNRPSGETFVSGGVVLATGIGATPPNGNTVRRNVVLRNSTDLVWDGTGTGNTFSRNVCATSQPDGLC